MDINWLDRTSVRLPYMALCLNEEEYLEVAKHCEISSPFSWLSKGGAATCHTWENDNKLICVICLRPINKDDPRDSINIACALVHEAVHVFQALCQNIGESTPSAEFEAYSIERITEQLLREYARRMQ